MKIQSILRGIAVCLALGAQLARGDNCVAPLLPSNPDTAYITNGDTVTDSRTGLMWKRCSEGQTWNSGTCTGTANYYDWGQALLQAVAASNTPFAGFSDWRLPNVKELRSLVEVCRTTTAINEQIFPGNPRGEQFWSSTPYKAVQGESWAIQSTDGGMSNSPRSYNRIVRLVRGGSQTISTPPSKKLNDTGITVCTQGSTTNVGNCATAPKQDAHYGRDATANQLAKVGAGRNGFDFTKIAGGDCVKDNVTGLTWEVKTTSGLRNYLHTYTFFDGGVGVVSGGVCETVGRCDTEKFVQDVREEGLCGFSDWRMPSVKELQGIIDYGLFGPAIDTSYFPNTSSIAYWTSTVVSSEMTSISWTVKFLNGWKQGLINSNKYPVRLVRGQP